METRRIYTKKLAYELRKKGYTILRTIPNEEKPQYDNYIFKVTEGIDEAIAELTGGKKNDSTVKGTESSHRSCI